MTSDKDFSSIDTKKSKISSLKETDRQDIFSSIDSKTRPQV